MVFGRDLPRLDKLNLRVEVKSNDRVQRRASSLASRPLRRSARLRAGLRTRRLCGAAEQDRMRLETLSEGYRQAAIPLREKLRQLRQALKTEDDALRRASLRHEIALLSGIMTQCLELAELTAHYYERGFWRNEKYTL